MILNTGGSGWGDNSSLTLLWENPDTKVAFEGGTTIPIDSNAYNVFLMLVQPQAGMQRLEANVVMNIAESNSMSIYAKYAGITYCRSITIHDGHIEVGPSENGGATNNKLCIPYRVYGLYPR